MAPSVVRKTGASQKGKMDAKDFYDIRDFMLKEIRKIIREELKTAPVQQTTKPMPEICPHYFEATDGVHVVVVGQCRCSGKLSA